MCIVCVCVLQCVAVDRGVLRCVAVCCNACLSWQRRGTHHVHRMCVCALQHTATHCKTLQRSVSATTNDVPCALCVCVCVCVCARAHVCVCSYVVYACRALKGSWCFCFRKSSLKLQISLARHPRPSDRDTVTRLVQFCCSVLQCVAVSCSVLQRVSQRHSRETHPVCCSVLQCVVVCYRVLPCVIVCCSLLHCVALCCSVLQCAVLCCNAMQRLSMCCNVLKCVAVCCI